MQAQPTYQELEKRLTAAAEALGKAEAKATAGRLTLELMHEVRIYSKQSGISSTSSGARRRITNEWSAIWISPKNKCVRLRK